MPADLRIGTSGWIYRHWSKVFYPARMRAGEHLAFYAGRFSTVEINYSFYRLPGREVFAAWRRQVPPDFVFAVKASRYLTHMRKLKEPAEPVAKLIEAADGLGEKLGPILFQFPAQWGKNLPRLEGLLEVLPAGRCYAFEFRHPTWLGEDVFTTLERHGCALCIPDAPGMPQERRLTAGFTYLRFHTGQFGAKYTPEELAQWAERVCGFLEDGADVYAYFNNDIHGHAIENAVALRSLLGQDRAQPS